jgi:hypothetical protein
MKNNSVLFLCFRIVDMQKVFDGEIEIEAMDSHNNWLYHSQHPLFSLVFN